MAEVPTISPASAEAKTQPATASSPSKEEKKDLTLLEMQKARQELDKDSQLLANRIALLRQEESKAKKKIQEARKQARDLLIKKEQTEKTTMEKAEKMRQSEEAKEQSKKDFLDMQKQRQTNIRSIQDQIMAAKYAEAQNRKKERLHNDKLKQTIEKQYVMKNHMKKASVRTKEEMTTKKMRAFHEQKEEMAKTNHVQRMVKEQQKIKKKESELARMERIEGELIGRLKNTEKMQNEAAKQLEEVILSMGSTRKNPRSSPGLTPSPKKSPEASPAAASAAAPAPVSLPAEGKPAI